MNVQELEKRIAKEAAYIIAGAQTTIAARAFHDAPRTPEEEQHAREYIDHLVLFLSEVE